MEPCQDKVPKWMRILQNSEIDFLSRYLGKSTQMKYLGVLCEYSLLSDERGGLYGSTRREHPAGAPFGSTRSIVRRHHICLLGGVGELLLVTSSVKFRG